MSFRWLALTLLFFALSAAAQDSALVRIGSEWKFAAPGTRSLPGDGAWMRADYDDSSWLAGSSGFSTSTGAFAATLLPPAPEGVHLLRRAFVVDDPAEIPWLTLRIDYQDGFAAFLNGREIARRNLPGAPGQPVSFRTRASEVHRFGATEEIPIVVFPGLLHAGTNVLAIQAHGTHPGDPVLGVVPELLAGFTRGPYVQNMSSNRVHILWKTTVPSTTEIELEANGERHTAFLSTNLVTTHVAALTNLAPATLHLYRARSEGADGSSICSPGAEFRTFSPSGPARFLAVGDTGSGSADQFAVARAMQTAPADFLLHAGDTVYPSLIFSRADNQLLSIYQPQMRSMPYFPAFGNHDIYSGTEAYLDAFYLPTNTVTGGPQYYSFDHGDAHFTVFFLTMFQQYRMWPTDSHYHWLSNDLASSSKPWKILLFHHPVRSSGFHSWDDMDGNGAADQREIEEMIQPLAARHGVQLIINGHDHGFERFAPVGGAHCVVTGGGGAGLYPRAVIDPISAQFRARHHFIAVSIEDDELAMQAVGKEGEVFDEMKIRRRAEPPRERVAEWNSPLVEIQPANDGDGNIAGQRFEVAGETAVAVTGRESNLGALSVNNDAEFLYLGLRSVMLRPGQDIALFAGSARRSGAAALRGLGNGRADSSEEGADGLDRLENLSFGNFRPSIACLIGDELGDSQWRSFLRAGAAVNHGQGVFLLDQGFSDVPGARMQQFNRSPQEEPVMGEEGADFIEMAIPLAALGGLRAGDEVQIAAVVLLPSESDAVFGPPALDTGFIGQDLRETGPREHVLDAITVRLAENPDQDGDGLTRAEEERLGTNPALPDTDGDGLRDGWEAKHGLDPLSGFGADGASGDPDHDEASNAQEQAAGTDPRDAASVLRLAMTLRQAGTFRLSWLAVPGMRYEILAADRSEGPFVEMEGPAFPLAPQSTNGFFDANLSLDSSQRYFRVRATP